MAKNKSKELLLAEIAYRAGVMDALAIQGIVELEHVDAMVVAGAALALKKWKAQTGGRAPKPSEVQIARRDWEAAGKPPEGIQRSDSGRWYKFKPNGEYDISATLLANANIE